MTTWERIEGGLWGLLVGDAAGVPYEFREPFELPPRDLLGPRPPDDFVRSYRDVPLGTWSDDGAQALCLLRSLLESGGTLNLRSFANHLHAWILHGHMAVDRRVFDVGIQTGTALGRLKRGVALEAAGLGGERNNGNGSLMRVLPLVLLHRGSDAELVELAHLQSRITHRHPRSQACCALYCLWARGELLRWEDPWGMAVDRLRHLYAGSEEFREELENEILAKAEPAERGSGYVVDCLLSARLACQKSHYAEVIREALSFGRDTDTTACVAGGIAGLRHGVAGIPAEWRAMLRGREILDPMMEALWAFRGREGREKV